MSDQITTITAKRSDVLIDPDLNSRKTIDQKALDRLTSSIKAQGIISPCLVIHSSQLGKKYENSPQPLVLIAGFRRQAALDAINGTEAEVVHEYRLAPESWDLSDAMAANLTENLAREDISPYELATRCAELRAIGLTPEEISKKVRALDCEQGDRKPLSVTHINNLVRCATQLQPEILEAWKAQHPRASVRVLIQLAAEKDAAIQLSMWKGIENPQPEGEEGGEGEGGGGSSQLRESKDKRPRPTRPQLEIMIEAVKAAGKEGKREPEYVRGAVAALKYAAGLSKGIPGVKAVEESEAE